MHGATIKILKKSLTKLGYSITTTTPHLEGLFTNAGHQIWTINDNI
jgi:hypothetical protein